MMMMTTTTKVTMMTVMIVMVMVMVSQSLYGEKLARLGRVIEPTLCFFSKRFITFCTEMYEQLAPQCRSCR